MDATINIFSARGDLVYKKDIRIEKGENYFQFSYQDIIISGMYTLSITSKDLVIATERIIKE